MFAPPKAWTVNLSTLRCLYEEWLCKNELGMIETSAPVSSMKVRWDPLITISMRGDLMAEAGNGSGKTLFVFTTSASSLSESAASQRGWRAQGAVPGGTLPSGMLGALNPWGPDRPTSEPKGCFPVPCWGSLVEPVMEAQCCPRMGSWREDAKQVWRCPRNADYGGQNDIHKFHRQNSQTLDVCEMEMSYSKAVCCYLKVTVEHSGNLS